MGDRWTLRIGFDTRAEVVEAWKVAVGEGGWWVRSEQPPKADQVELVLVAGLEALEPMRARVAHGRPSGEPNGFWLEPEPTAQLLAMVGECAAPPWMGSPRRVLVIDDEPIWRSALARVLKQMGCQVHLAADGLEGMRKVTDLLLELDLVVVDLHLPYFDGREVLETVREAGREGELKLVLFSGAGPDELEMVRKTGYSNLVLSKLEPLDHVSALLREMLGLAPVQARAA